MSQKHLLTNVHWSLGWEKHDRYEDFIAAVSTYNEEIAPGKHSWRPDEIVAQGPLRIVYEAGWKDVDDTIAIEVGERGRPLSMGQLLFAVNNATVEFFRDADTHFFEGFDLVAGNQYRLMMGS